MLKKRSGNTEDFTKACLENRLMKKNNTLSLMVIELDNVVLATLLIGEKNGVIYPLINSMMSSVTIVGQLAIIFCVY